MSKKVENLEKEIDKHEQYSRRNCLLAHGIVETDDEVTVDLVIEIISMKMNIEISPADLDRTHRIGKRRLVKINQDQLYWFFPTKKI